MLLVTFFVPENSLCTFLSFTSTEHWILVYCAAAACEVDTQRNHDVLTLNITHCLMLMFERIWFAVNEYGFKANFASVN